MGNDPAPFPDHAVTPRNTAIGIVLLLGEIIVFLAVAGGVKILSADFPVFAILFCRFFFSLPLLLAYGIARRGRLVLHVHDRRNLVGRVVCGFIGLVFMYLAFGLVEFSLAAALIQTMPVFITLLAIPMLGEEAIGPRRIAAVCVAFAGVVVLLGVEEIMAAISGVLHGGGGTGQGFGILAALLGAFFTGLMLIYLRRLGRREAAVTTALWYNITGMVCSFIAGIFDGSVAALLGGGIGVAAWVLLVGIGMLSAFQQFMLALAYAFAPASTLAPVHYANIPIAAAIGILFFGEIITVHFVIGSVIIIGANYYILVREQALKRVHGHG